ncbi:hypothetical protein [Psychroflexus aestuariivivens]|uniref:hypothetical protein n=1 Tax=Psychroflexus aestuariivivens TaxID=1795040 RepID=UPI000FDBD46B|nr:hypothetical protein [Psychroflexus aestuariivivens]
MKNLKALSYALIAFVVLSCNDSTDVVESGTYEGTIMKVEADKSEIYVQTEDDKTLELYFTDETELTQNGEKVEFSVLKKDQKVEVEVEKVGKRLDPLSVKVLE